MNTKRTDQTAKRQPIDSKRAEMIAELRTLESLLWRKLLAGLSPAMREALLIHGLLSDMTDAVVAGQPLTHETVRPVIDAAGVCLSGFRD